MGGSGGGIDTSQITNALSGTSGVSYTWFHFCVIAGVILMLTICLKGLRQHHRGQNFGRTIGYVGGGFFVLILMCGIGAVVSDGSGLVSNFLNAVSGLFTSL